MAEEEQKKGRLATAVLAGSALAFSSFAFGAPAALADTESSANSSEQENNSTDADNQSSLNTQETGDENNGNGQDESSDNDEETDKSEDDVNDVNPTIKAESQAVAPGDSFTLSGTGFTPNGEVLFTMKSDDKKNAITIAANSADEDGDVETNVEIPDDAASGDYTVVAEDSQSGETVQVAVTVNGEDSADEGEENDAGEDSADEGEENDAGEDSADEGEENNTGEDSADEGEGDGNDAGEDSSGEGDGNDTSEDTDDTTNDDGEDADDEDGEQPAVEPEVALSADQLYPGQTVTVTGSGFTADSTVTVTVDWEDDPAQSESDADGGFTGSFAVPRGQEPGTYTVTVVDDATDTEVSAEFEVLELDEPILQISPEEITLTDFIRDAEDDEDDSGVVHEIIGLDEGDEIEAIVEGPEGVEATELDATADENGVASFEIYGYDHVEPASTYVGTYESEVTIVEADSDPLQGSFAVVEDANDEDPEEPGDQDPEQPGDDDAELDLNLELDVNEAYPGETIDVAGSGFTANGTVEFSINPPLGNVEADDNGAFDTEVTLPEDLDPGQYEFTALDVETDQEVRVDFTVLDDADEAGEASLSIDPKEIQLDDFVGDPEDGAGVTHVVENVSPGTDFTYLVRGPEGVNEFEQSGTADDEGVAEFVIHGFEVSDPDVYLGDYTTVVTYEDADGETAELQGDFAVVTGDGSTGSTTETASSGDAADSGEPIELNGSDRLANTGADNTHLGLIAGVLLALGGTLVVVANRKRLFARKS